MSTYKKVTEITSETHVKGDQGVIVITGYAFPENKKFAILDKIWSSVRKRILEKYKVHVTGIFINDPEKAVISGSLILSYATETDEKYQQRFVETFMKQMQYFEKVLEDFYMNENGLKTYQEYLDSVDAADVDVEKCNQILDEFLKSVGAKTDKDEIKKEKWQKRLEKL